MGAYLWLLEAILPIRLFGVLMVTVQVPQTASLVFSFNRTHKAVFVQMFDLLLDLAGLARLPLRLMCCQMP